MTMCFGNYDDDEVVKFASEMTLRDYFAGKALTGLLAESNNEYFDDNIVDLAYSLADAMIKRRDR